MGVEKSPASKQRVDEAGLSLERDLVPDVFRPTVPCLTEVRLGASLVWH